jgi:hypothetical protein
MKSNILYYCDGLMHEASSHTRELYRVIEHKEDRTPNESYSYWMGYKRAANEMWLYIKGLKNSEIEIDLTTEKE